MPVRVEVRIENRFFYIVGGNAGAEQLPVPLAVRLIDDVARVFARHTFLSAAYGSKPQGEMNYYCGMTRSREFDSDRCPLPAAGARRLLHGFVVAVP